MRVFDKTKNQPQKSSFATLKNPVFSAKQNHRGTANLVFVSSVVFCFVDAVLSQYVSLRSHATLAGRPPASKVVQ